jgi:hypothetical protein
MTNEDIIEVKSQEIKRLHNVARAKDETLKDCISTCKAILKHALPEFSPEHEPLTLQQLEYYYKSIKDFEKSIG